MDMKSLSCSKLHAEQTKPCCTNFGLELKVDSSTPRVQAGSWQYGSIVEPLTSDQQSFGF